MRALVTGASGFIGSHLIEELNTLGFDVLALMRKSSSPANLDGLKYERVEGDLADLDSLRRAVKDADYVFHLAGTLFSQDRQGYFDHNVGGTRRLAQAVAENRPGLNRFVYVSSLAAGGPASSQELRREEDSDAPVSAYGQSKLQAEQELSRFKEAFPISVIRPPMVYGPRDKATFVFVQTVASNLMPLIRGKNPEGHKYYSTIHVQDLCRGMVQAGLAPVEKVPSGEVFYLCSNEVVTYEGILSTIADHLDREPLRFKVPMAALKIAAHALTAVGRVTQRPFSLNSDKFNEMVPDYWICSNQKAKRMLGFTPEFEFSRGMANAVEWYKRHEWI